MTCDEEIPPDNERTHTRSRLKMTPPPPPPKKNVWQGWWYCGQNTKYLWWDCNYTANRSLSQSKSSDEQCADKKKKKWKKNSVINLVSDVHSFIFWSHDFVQIIRRRYVGFLFVFLRSSPIDFNTAVITVWHQKRESATSVPFLLRLLSVKRGFIWCSNCRFETELWKEDAVQVFFF